MLSYHKALKQWNTLGGQQGRTVKLTEVWGNPRRGSEAHREVLQQMSQVEAPKERMKMRRPVRAPRVVGNEDWSSQPSRYNISRSVRPSLSNWFGDKQADEVSLRSKYTHLSELASGLIDRLHSRLWERSGNTYAQKYHSRNYDQLEEMVVGEIMRRRTKEGSPADIRKRAEAERARKEIRQEEAEGKRNLETIQRMIAPFVKMKEEIDTVRWSRTGEGASNTHFNKLAARFNYELDILREEAEELQLLNWIGTAQLKPFNYITLKYEER